MVEHPSLIGNVYLLIPLFIDPQHLQNSQPFKILFSENTNKLYTEIRSEKNIFHKIWLIKWLIKKELMIYFLDWVKWIIENFSYIL